MIDHFYVVIPVTFLLTVEVDISLSISIALAFLVLKPRRFNEKMVVKFDF